MARPKSYKRRQILKINSPKTTTKKGRNDYMKEYMRIRRAELRGKGVNALCKIDLQKTLGIDLRKLTRRSR